MTLAGRRPIVMLVTSRARLAERVGATPNDLESVTPHLLSQIESAAASGVTVIQLREPDLEARALARLTRAAMRVIAGTEASLVVNGRVDVALATGAHGVHLPEHGLPPDRVRALLPRPSLVGASIHAPVPALDGRALDYAVFGTIYETRSKAPWSALAGLDGLRRAVDVSAIPVLAIGGVTLARIAEIAATGAGGFAAIELFLPAAGSSSRASLRKILESAREAFDTVGDVS
jgi:thiamine-phosphate pyrophosphorylase